MATYYISDRNGAGDILGKTRAESIQEAAQHWARRTYGRRASAGRVTGTVGMGGIFQAYVPTGQSGYHLTSIGSPFCI